MIKPASSLLAKILCWFFLNLILVVTALTVFFAFQPQVNLHAVFGQQGSNRLRKAGFLIAHDLTRTARAGWSEVLARHAGIHQVDFVLDLRDGSYFSSKKMELPEKVRGKVREAFRRKPRPGRFPPPPDLEGLKRRPEKHLPDDPPGLVKKRPARKPHLMIRTRQPTLYWSGVLIPLPPDPPRPPVPAILLAVSDSVTGKGFFFDPVPWMVVAGTVILISVLFWIPMVRHITRPLSRMTRATEEIARGGFDISLPESRTDEIGRLAGTINHMADRLSGFIKGQKRFLGDVAHELGSPIARIQFGLSALEQRVEKKNQGRVAEVLEDVEQLSNLVNELLAFSRADLKKESVKLERIELLPVVQAALKRESKPSVEIITRVDPRISVLASSELLTRAVANLIRNAVKYAGEAGPISISAQRRKDVVALEVRDSGPGAPDDLLDQLFEPFFRPQAARDSDSGGVGLGLAIVRTCIETCQGTVSASNLKPRGLAVRITLRA